MDDIFKFWAGLTPEDAHVHPADANVLTRVVHNFKLDCLAAPFIGPLQTAPVVLLFLSPGLDEGDVRHATTADARAYYTRQREGCSDLPSDQEHASARNWASRIVKHFEVDYDDNRNKIAFLNIAPYKSKTFEHWNMLAALPSARAALGWAQTVLFPKAAAGDRTVVCLRSAKYWGLGKETKIGVSLFAPKFTRGGFMHKGEGTIRDEVVAAVKSALNPGS